MSPVGASDSAPSTEPGAGEHATSGVSLEGLVRWAARSRALPGEVLCGDHFVWLERGGDIIAAVIDGLGHGAEADAAARAAVECITRSASVTVQELLTECHAALRRTRGAAITVLVIDVRGSRVRWGGVGNVDAVALAADRTSKTRLLPTGGVVGYVLPTVRVREFPFAPGAVVGVWTDGFATEVSADIQPVGAPAGLAELLMNRHATASDDALILLAVRAGAS